MQSNEHEFMPIPKEPLPLTTAEEHIKNDFQFVHELKTVQQDGTTYLADKAGNLLNASTSITESDFINNWMDGFSLGRVGKQSYFDFNTWLEMTNHGTESVVVVDDSDPTKTLFIIPAISIPRFTAKEQRAVNVAGARLASARHAHDQKDHLRATQIITGATKLINTEVSDEPSHLSDYVPLEYFAKHGILPAVRQNLVYCRDYFGLNPAFRDDWEFAEKIFTKIFFHEELSPQDKRFMEILTGGKWKAPVYSGDPPQIQIGVGASDKDETGKKIPDMSYTSLEVKNSTDIGEDPFGA